MPDGRPHRNRVTPEGDLVAVPARGTMYGNRGVLHDDAGRVVRRWQVRRWLVCELSFRGRRRPLLRPGRYTELFFLDEAVALAAGHRPCAECRHAAYQEFRRLWTDTRGGSRPPSAGEIDDVLHAEREPGRPSAVDTRRNGTPAPVAGLPDGVLVAGPGGRPHLVAGDALRPWSPDGYGEPVARPSSGTVAVLTPPSTVAVLRAGYPVRVHPSGHPDG